MTPVTHMFFFNHPEKSNPSLGTLNLTSKGTDNSNITRVTVRVSIRDRVSIRVGIRVARTIYVRVGVSGIRKD